MMREALRTAAKWFGWFAGAPPVETWAPVAQPGAAKYRTRITASRNLDVLGPSVYRTRIRAAE